MKVLGILCGVFVLVSGACGFSLLGPHQTWMTETLSYRLPGDIGGPMSPLAQYRWNLPMVTYGFDQSFLDYFGEDGVRAVEEAFAILNQLPPMSQIDLDDYPTDTRMVNFEAQSLGYLDLKSHTLSLLLHQMGLAEPSRYTYALISRRAQATVTNHTIIRLNYDPATFAPATNVNDARYAYQILETANPLRADALEYLVDPLARGWTAVADGKLSAGEFYTGLTRDDVGGLRFLLRTNTITVEKLAVPVSFAPVPTNPGPTASSWMPQPPKPATNVIDTAPRSGVDKLTFVRMAWDSNHNQFPALTNVFVDAYYTNGQRRQQTLQRVVTRPDILFRARDLGVEIYNVPFPPGGSAYSFFPRFTAVSDTSRWNNHDDINGFTIRGGPGVIPPGATIDFGTVGRYLELARALGGSMYQWATFDGSTNPPVAFTNSNPAATVTISAQMRREASTASFEWTVLGIPDAVYRIESTTDFITWSTVTNVTNVVGHFVFTDPVATPQRFYRAVRQ